MLLFHMSPEIGMNIKCSTCLISKFVKNNLKHEYFITKFAGDKIGKYKTKTGCAVVTLRTIRKSMAPAFFHGIRGKSLIFLMLLPQKG